MYTLVLPIRILYSTCHYAMRKRACIFVLLRPSTESPSGCLLKSTMYQSPFSFQTIYISCVYMYHDTCVSRCVPCSFPYLVLALLAHVFTVLMILEAPNGPGLAMRYILTEQVQLWLAGRLHWVLEVNVLTETDLQTGVMFTHSTVRRILGSELLITLTYLTFLFVHQLGWRNCRA